MSEQSQDTQAETTWYGNIEDPDIKSWAEKKNFATPVDALKSYRELEKFIGAPKEKIIKLPESGSLDELRPIFDKLGRPATFEGYDIPKADDDSIGFNEWFKRASHDAGLTAAQARQMAEQYDKFGTSILDNEKQHWEQSYTSEIESLKKEWGQRFDENKAVAAMAVKSIANEEMYAAIEKAIGPKQALELFATIGQRTGEGKFVESRIMNDALPARRQDAQEELKRMRTDPDLRAKLSSKDPATIRRWQELIKIVA